MTDGQTLFAVFAALYLIECIRWLPPGMRLLVGGGGSGWRLRSPMHFLQARGLGAALLPVLPPLGAHVLAAPWPFAPSPKGLRLTADDTKHRLIPWQDVEPRLDGCFLALAASIRIRFLTEADAAHWHEILQSWLEMDDAARSASFSKLAKPMLNSAAAEKLAKEMAAQTGNLRLLGGWLFVLCFGGVTLVYRWHGEGLRLWMILGILLALQLTQAVLFARHRAFKGIPFRWWKTLGIALLPQFAMRAADLILKQNHTRPHPLAAVRVMRRQDWLPLAASTWRQARYQPGWEDAEDSEPEAHALNAFFKREDVAIETLEETPEASRGSVAYCPRCHSQFSRADAACADCGGVALRAFGKTGG